MDIRKIKKLIELLEESGLAEIEITEGEESVRIARVSQRKGRRSGRRPATIGMRSAETAWQSASAASSAPLAGPVQPSS